MKGRPSGFPLIRIISDRWIRPPAAVVWDSLRRHRWDASWEVRSPQRISPLCRRSSTPCPRSRGFLRWAAVGLKVLTGNRTFAFFETFLVTSSLRSTAPQISLSAPHGTNPSATSRPRPSPAAPRSLPAPPVQAACFCASLPSTAYSSPTQEMSKASAPRSPPSLPIPAVTVRLSRKRSARKSKPACPPNPGGPASARSPAYSRNSQTRTGPSSPPRPVSGRRCGIGGRPCARHARDLRRYRHNLPRWKKPVPQSQHGILNQARHSNTNRKTAEEIDCESLVGPHGNMQRAPHKPHEPRASGPVPQINRIGIHPHPGKTVSDPLRDPREALRQNPADVKTQQQNAPITQIYCRISEDGEEFLVPQEEVCRG